MKPIIPPIEKELLLKELTKDRFLRPTNKADNEIYVVTAHDSPHVMLEIGRLREHSYRSGGGGSGNEIDTDAYDYLEKPYKQLIVWDPKGFEIIGGYRFLEGSEVEFSENGQPNCVMSHLFTFSDKYIKEYLPYSIELGRAFVQPDYQTSRMGLKSLFALDNLWDGLGALIHSCKNTRYFIGKVTIYNSYVAEARELIYEYMFRYFPDPDELIKPKKIIDTGDTVKLIASDIFQGNNASRDYKSLQKAVRKVGETIPPMFNAYIGLTDTMRMFGNTIDHNFGSVYETGIMVTMADLLETKRKRYIEPYIEYLKIFISEQEKLRKLSKVKRLAAKQIKKEIKKSKKNKTD
ncbi:MAG: GNAT family N-acetyltransferase [Paludibacter sp.]|nr:GNAT family N-acetyltransferase [Paludibacter sp.]